MRFPYALIVTWWNNLQSNLHVAVSSLVAASVVWMSEPPAKLNPIIYPLMASIKREQVMSFDNFFFLSIQMHAY